MNRTRDRVHAFYNPYMFIMGTLAPITPFAILLAPMTFIWRRPTIVRGEVWWLSILAVSGLTLSAILSPLDSLPYLGHVIAVSCIISFSVTLMYSVKEAQRRHLFCGLLIGGLVNSSIAIAQFLGGQFPATGLLFHHNLLAATLAVCAAASLVGFRAKLDAFTVLRLLAFSVISAGFLLSASRAGIISLVVTAIVFGLIKFRRATMFFLIAMIALGLITQHLTNTLPGSAAHIISPESELGNLYWQFGASTLPTNQTRGRAVHLRSTSESWEVLLEYRPHIRVGTGQLAVSFDYSPDPETVTSPILHLVAVDRLGNNLAIFDGDSWAAPQPDRKKAPISGLRNSSDGQHYVELPELPAHAYSLKFSIISEGHHGSYGTITNISINSPSTVNAVQPRLSLPRWLVPFHLRLLELRYDLVSASGGRLDMYRLAGELIRQRPILGYGPGADSQLIDEFGHLFVSTPLNHFHSSPLRLILNGGLAVAALIMTLACQTIHLRVGNAKQDGINHIVMSALLAVFIMALFDDVLSHSQVFFSLLLLTSGMFEDESTHDEQ